MSIPLPHFFKVLLPVPQFILFYREEREGKEENAKIFYGNFLILEQIAISQNANRMNKQKYL